MTIELHITGMTCGHCRASVYRALTAVPGVVEATVDLATGKAQVTGNPAIEQLLAAVEEEGYTAQLTVRHAG